MPTAVRLEELIGEWGRQRRVQTQGVPASPPGKAGGDEGMKSGNCGQAGRKPERHIRRPTKKAFRGFSCVHAAGRSSRGGLGTAIVLSIRGLHGPCQPPSPSILQTDTYGDESNQVWLRGAYQLAGND